MSLYVTDAHALIWYASGRTRKLGRRARAAYTAAEAGRAAIYVPALALVEVLECIARGELRPALPVGEWVRALSDTGSFHFVPLTLEVAEAARELHRIPERGDRLIAATARVLGHPLLTRDPAIEGIDTVW